MRHTVRVITSDASFDGRRRPDRRMVADWTLAQTHALIFSGALVPGDSLNEVDLAERLHVSRSPVRDALKELEHAGLIDIDEVNGRRVLRSFGIDEASELYDIRTELEVLAARRAADVLSTPGHDALGLAVDEIGKASKDPVEAYLRKDFAFHQMISDLSGMRRVPQMLSRVYIQHLALLTRLDRVHAYPVSSAERRVANLEHRRILDAIVDHDPDAAAAAARAHLNGRRQTVMEGIHRNGGAI